ncbi:MAG: O-antigen ligase family protein [Patescibacteria group bacterium]
METTARYGDAGMRKFLIIIFLLTIPWQTRWIFGDTMINGAPSEYGRLFVSLGDLTAAFIAAVWLFGLRKQFRRRRFLENRLRFIFLLPALSVISSLWAPEPLLAIQIGARLFLAYAVIFALKDETLRFRRECYAVFAVALVPSAIIGVWQILVQYVDASTALGIAGQFPLRLGTAVVELNGVRVLRAYGTFSHPNIFGGAMALGIVSALFCSSFLKRSWRRRSLCAVATILTVGLFASVSRAALLTLVVATVAWIFAVRHRADEYRRGRTVVRGIVAGLLVGVALFGNLWTARADMSGRLEKKSVDDRVSEWSLARDIVAEKPFNWIVGVGAGNFVFKSAEIKPGMPVYDYQPTHNVFALLFAEFGLVGLALAFLTIGPIRPIRRIGLIYASLFILMFFDHWLWTQPFGLYATAIFVGLL